MKIAKIQGANLVLDTHPAPRHNPGAFDLDAPSLHLGPVRFLRQFEGAMRIRPFLLQTVIVAVCLTSSSIAQQNTTADAVVPNVINYSGTLTDLNGKPLSGIQGVTFLLYSGE